MTRLSVAALSLVPVALALIVACSEAAAAATAPAGGAASSDQDDYDYDSGAAANGEASAAADTSAGGKRETAISGFAFEETITVPAGTEVVWTNLDGAGHTVSAREGAFDSGATLGQGQSFSFTFDRAGRYEFYCQIHPSMTGTVVVR